MRTRNSGTLTLDDTVLNYYNVYETQRERNEYLSFKHRTVITTAIGIVYNILSLLYCLSHNPTFYFSRAASGRSDEHSITFILLHV
jgi:hypothetical protein